MKKKILILCLLLGLVLGAAGLWAGAISVRPFGIATPYWYGHSSGASSTYYLAHPTLTANDTAAGIAATQTLTNKTIAAASNTITNLANANLATAAAIANTKLAAPNSYFIITIHHEGQETATLDPVATFQMPFAATLVEVSVCARDIDTTNADETYTVDLEEAGTTVLSAAVAITADNTPVVGTVSDSAIADNAKMELVLTLGGTTPAIDDLTILLTFKVAHAS